MNSLLTRLRHLLLGLRLLPDLLRNAQQRQLLAEMRVLGHQLPGILKQPLPQAMAELEMMRLERPFPLPSESKTRQLTDLAALLDRQSPLGLCLRRSLLRYRYLHELDVPVTVLFGAKFAPGETPDKKKITGHAWLVLAERPYHEDDENWQGYTVMLRWPNS
ncbi:MAG: lasso peptide biosynthesis protein [Ardenticatenaceae bacterium]|nr:lasso peptide biosynthesis protein [Ardenticatenaceae bacterium]MCB8946639.1 lasso peptide biosynthesis protein [Ardenticatenaceae bacterium]